MKKLIYLLALSSIVISCTREPQFVLKGKIEGISDGRIILEYLSDGIIEITDTTDLVDGAFTFTGKIEFPTTAYISIVNMPGRKWFFLENSKILFEAHLDSLIDAEISGSKTQDDYNHYRDLEEEFYQTNIVPLSELKDIYLENNDLGVEESINDLERKIEIAYKKYDQIGLDFILQNSSSFASPVILRMIGNRMDANELESYLTGFDKILSIDPNVIYLEKKLEILKNVTTGKQAPDFTSIDVNKDSVRLSTLFGSYLLIDFWASWCKPCRKEYPILISVYNKYHNKGFEILGISLDKSKEDWLKAIEDESLTWINVSDQKAWDSEAVRLYSISTIPSNFLLDKNGIIIAKDLSGEELSIKLSELIRQ